MTRILSSSSPQGPCLLKSTRSPQSSLLGFSADTIPVHLPPTDRLVYVRMNKGIALYRSFHWPLISDSSPIMQMHVSSLTQALDCRTARKLVAQGLVFVFGRFHIFGLHSVFELVSRPPSFTRPSSLTLSLVLYLSLICHLHLSLSLT